MGDGMIGDPELTGVPFNDAYRYMDWLLTVPLLLIEIVFVMDLSPEETVNKATSLGVASGLMIVLGYPGELILKEDELSGRWMYWFMAMIPFVYVMPMFGVVGPKAVVGIQLGYCFSDIISKCGVGLLIFGVSSAKSKKLLSDPEYAEVQAK